MKYCSACNSQKNLDDFYNNKATGDGKSTYCKPCHSAYIKQRSVKTKQRRAETNRAWYLKNRQRKAQTKKVWLEQNKSKVLAKQAEYRQKNKQVIALKTALYAQENPHKIRASALRQCAKRKGAKIFHISDREIIKMLSSQCSVTGCTNLDIEMDHVIPLSRGGSHCIGNLQPMCTHHNRVKNNKTNMEFRVYMQKKYNAA